MCGIFSYIGKKEAAGILLNGLQALEYRGYDSAGMFVSGTGVIKAVGKVSGLGEKIKEIKGTVGIAHTRWATHGIPSEQNAHPHTGNKRRVWLVHNGIIENYKEIKEALLKKKHTFYSQTDTEVLAHLIEQHLENEKDVLKAIRKAVKEIKGSYALAVINMDEQDKVVTVRKGSPLVIGVGEGELFASSDVTPILSHTKRVIYLNDNEIAVLKDDTAEFYEFSGKRISKGSETITWNAESSKKGGYKHFMLKEIMEQPEVVNRAIAGRIVKNKIVLQELKNIHDRLTQVNKVMIVGCGTAFYSGMIGKYLIEEFASIGVEIDIASEFRYRTPVIDKNTLCIVLSQSGETADTLEALRIAKRKGALTLGMVNVVGSTISREVDTCIYTMAGPEIGVASTKAFLSQVIVMMLFSAEFAKLHGDKKLEKEVSKSLLTLADDVASVLSKREIIKKVAIKYADYTHFLFLGRNYQLPIAYEGALKLKEISYIHAEAYGSGEMKHGPLAMIDKNFPSLIISLKDNLYEKNISSIQEIKAREGKVISIATKGDEMIKTMSDDVVYLPDISPYCAPLLVAVVLQLFAYYVAEIKGCAIDQPRNLAKSVTVE